ncbi:hypothetical protein M409DRAFT_16009 [Zasmidium cellare ATCC 36951]|uniref:tyrosinase n=1 Tax=Zasmidium cellare ATCC 36951 TaxID=1080233 RepID=A0A6A6D3V8_ZASCE|nr:uncharacterized protein M409DRAFT_16009 [Zasmidium cellare ATCC 36951]KAF2173735.1 hypothetical protein M409DRAFT_16009 [Zasmidium cellare ATCC 36951]
MKTNSFQNHAQILLSLLCLSSASALLRHNVEDLSSAPDTPPLMRRQADNGTFAVTGVQGAGVQPRLEIRELERDADSWNLYVLGMQRFQATDQSDKLSYYRLCGIRGRPYEAWDGVEATGNSEDGYCAHVSNIFLTWHRPYLALYEQVLFEHVMDAANSFPTGEVRQRYISAARRWRMPYWDWAVEQEDGSSVYPQSVSTPEITVTLPNGSATIRNPLYSYRFHPVSEEDFFFNPFASWLETLRSPSGSTQNAVSRNQDIGSQLDANRNSAMNRLFNLFANYDNFTQFSNEAWTFGNVRNADSLEGLHDVIHGMTGGNGHMTFLDYSAFDPLFFLHHTMMDRCFALWQVMNIFTGQVEPVAAVSDTFTINVGEMVDGNTPLTPFHMDSSGKLFTSNDVMDTMSLGYTYPELANNTGRSTVVAKIRELYGSNAVSGGPVKRNAPAQRVSQAATKQQVHSAPGEVVEGRLQHYLANIVSTKFAMNNSYAIYIFLGDVQSEDPKTWPLCPNMVGTHAVFAGYAGAASSSKRSVEHNSMKVTGSIPLTDGLLQKVHNGDLPGMSNAEVGSYLRESLKWRVALMDGTAVNAEDVADLAITVVSAQVQPSEAEDEFPSWHNFKELKSITHGRPGGHRG